MSESILKVDAESYIKAATGTQENLSPEQWQTIETAKTQIKNGQYKTYAEVKEHFAQWLAK